MDERGAWKNNNKLSLNFNVKKDELTISTKSDVVR